MSDWDSTYIWNGKARESLMGLLNTPGIGAYPFEDALQVNYETSVDGRLTLISLDNNDGGSFVSYTNYLFFRNPDGTEISQCLGEDGLSPSGIDTVQFDSRVCYVWEEFSKTCNTCYGWALKRFDPSLESETPTTLLVLSGRISEHDYQVYDPETKIVTYSVTINEMMGSMSKEELQALWTDPNRLEVAEWNEYVKHGSFSIRRALMGTPREE
jgi:hypothetical protein